MIDRITTIFAIKGAIQNPRYSEYSAIIAGGEVEALDEVANAADVLEDQYAGYFVPDDFDHVVFAYDVAEPFGHEFVNMVIEIGRPVEPKDYVNLAHKILNEAKRDT